MRIGQYLREARALKGLSIRHLAGKVGVHPSYASRVERGQSRASREFLAKVARQLGLSEPHLLSLAGYMPKEWSEALAAEGLPNVRLCRSVVREAPLAYGGLKARSRNGRLRDPLSDILPGDYLVSPEMNELYELRLARLEASLLTRQEIIARGAYFLAVGGKPTNHFKICTGGSVELPEDTGQRLQSFLGTHRFKSSYATHGLFPYRGKFHPQMIKGIMNVIGAKPGDTILDPMAGSGTTAVEASLMGIDSVAVDASPFCIFMSRVKLAGLSQDLTCLDETIGKPREVRRLFDQLSSDEGKRKVRDTNYRPHRFSRECLELIALAYLDARGFSERSSRNSHEGFFSVVLTKYVLTIRKFQDAWRTTGLVLGKGRALLGDARQLFMDSESIDGVVFSPPYSFAIDYVGNDLPHLEYLGVDAKALRGSMIGLRGKADRERALQYFEDMNSVFKEVARVLRPGKYCAVIVGSNSNQLARTLGLDPASQEARYGIEMRVLALAEARQLYLELPIRRLIVGMANAMREEHILLLRKGG